MKSDSRRWMALLLLPALPLVAAAGDATPTPSARIVQAASTPDLDPRLAALADVGKSLAPTEVEEALRQAEKMNSLRERVTLTAAVLTRWAEFAPAEAFAHIAGMPEGVLKIECLRGVMPAFAAKDPRAAAEAVSALKSGRTRNDAVLMLADILARQDPHAATRWVEELPAGCPKEAARRNIHFIRAHQDPAGLAPVIVHLPAGPTKEALIINVAGNWARRDAIDAIHWAESLAAEAEKQLALVSVAEAWADVAPAEAAEFARKLEPAELRQRAVAIALERWATQHPEAAFAWAADVSETALASVLKIYATASPEASARKVRDLPPGPLRERAIAAHAEASCHWCPETATKLAHETQDPEARRQRVEPCYMLWQSWDPAAAKEWLAGTDFPEVIQQAWLTLKPDPET